MRRVAALCGAVNDLSLAVLEQHDINMVMEEDAVDFIISRHLDESTALEKIYAETTDRVVHGLKLVRQRTGRRRFFLPREALEAPEAYISRMIQSGTEDTTTAPVRLTFSSNENSGG
jgi:hypothetical protein